jgi:hypothetical protein
MEEWQTVGGEGMGTRVKEREGAGKDIRETEREENIHGNTIRDSFLLPRAAHQPGFYFIYHAVVRSVGSVLEYRLGAFRFDLGNLGGRQAGRHYSIIRFFYILHQSGVYSSVCIIWGVCMCDEVYIRLFSSFACSSVSGLGGGCSL